MKAKKIRLENKSLVVRSIEKVRKKERRRFVQKEGKGQLKPETKSQFNFNANDQSVYHNFPPSIYTIMVIVTYSFTPG